MRYLARIMYDGSKFQGFERLNNNKGVQNELERVLTKINNKEVLVKASGRTDALVHALDQCIHFDLDKNYHEQELKYKLNKMLNPYISVKKIMKVSDQFHARFSVVLKTYVYQIYLGEKNPFYNNYAYWYPYELNIKKMKEASKLFLGYHDYRNFVSGSDTKSFGKIDSIKIKKKKDFLYIELKGKSFYRYMVRNIVGALILVGKGKIETSDIFKALNNIDYKIPSFVAPANGLYLKKIRY